MRSCSSWLSTFWLRPHSRCSVDRTSQQEVLRVVEPRRVRRSAPQQQRIGEHRDRARRGEIAKRAGRVLHVGLELIQRVVEFRVALLDQREQRAQDERVRARLVEDRAEPLEHRARARHRPRVEQRQQELGVVGLELLKILDVADLVADHDAEIPERVQKAVHEALFGRADAVAEEQEQIDVRVQAQVTAPVSAKRDDRERPVVRTGVGEQLPDQRVDAIGVPLERAAAAGAARDRGAQLLPRGIERGSQRRTGRIRLRYGHDGDIPGLARTII